MVHQRHYQPDFDLLHEWPDFPRQVEACLRRHPAGLTEHQLLRSLQDAGVFSQWLDADPTLALFQKHFSVMHCLYRLKPRFRESGEELYISPLRIQLLQGDSELAAGSEVASFSASLRDYYQDWAHFREATPETVGDLLRDFWQRFAADDQKSDALRALELDADASWDDIQVQYRRLAREHHPDKGGSARRFAEVREAYEVLKKRLRG